MDFFEKITQGLKQANFNLEVGLKDEDVDQAAQTLEVSVIKMMNRLLLQVVVIVLVLMIVAYFLFVKGK